MINFIGKFGFGQPIQTSITLNNPSDKEVALKIKSTASEQHVLSPNCGKLDPKEGTRISGIL